MNWHKKDECVSIEDVVYRNLGVKNKEEIDAWFEMSSNKRYYINGLEDAAKMILVDKSRRIRICGDYDVDGRCASIILYLALTFLGFKNVDVRIPRRFSEGYGMTPAMIDEVVDDNALVITVDNGIAALDAVAHAKSRGMSVIVTDHHQPQVVDGERIYPDADIVIDPNAIPGSAKFNGYCGAGIAYKLACELIGYERAKKILLPYAAIATIADVMELREENYVFVKEGLQMLSARNAAPGLLALLDTMDIQTCTSASVGFKIGPALNAPGRMADRDKVTLPLLASKDIVRARGLATQIVEKNKERKKAVVTGVEEAKKILDSEEYEPGNMIVVSLPGVTQGILGIIAGRLSEIYCAPAIVLSGADENGMMHGSARSVDGLDIIEMIRSCGNLFDQYGGHAQAAGVTIFEGNYITAKTALQDAFASSGFQVENIEDAEYDLSIEADEVAQVLDALDKFEPFGQGNPRPIFKINNFHLVKKPMQIAGNGVRLSGDGISAVGFGMWNDFIGHEDVLCSYDIYGTISWNEFRGRKSPQIEIIDTRRCDTKLETPFAASLRAM